MRTDTENFEKQSLSQYARCAADSLGRERDEPQCDVRTVFQRDVDRITYSRSFRRLMHKTQVFLNPDGDHYRTRMTHTFEVARIARTMARGLRANEDLTEAIALGHDLGHTPFGHAGEAALGGVMDGGFSHREQSLRVVTCLEKNGAGLNLTAETKDGILHHSGTHPAMTLEGKLVHLADRIAYLSHDMDDAMCAGILAETDIPAHLREALGTSSHMRIDTLVRNVIANSQNSDIPCYTAQLNGAMNELREFMFEHVYRSPVAKGEEKRAQDMLLRLFEHYVGAPETMPSEFRAIADREGKARAVCDYIAGMTDRYATSKAMELFIPRGWGH